MSKADEMFEELGYEKIETEDEIRYLQWNGELKEYSEQYGYVFRKSYKEIYPACFERRNDVAIDITMQELKAINEKVKELRVVR